MLKRTQPELLPGADPETDCQPSPAGVDPAAELVPSLPDEAAAEQEDEHEHEHDVTWGGAFEASRPGQGLHDWQPVRTGWARALERLALWVEHPVNRLTGTQLNPFYHTGTIAVLLLGVVGLTGLYLFLFFQYGFDASYDAVARLQAQPIARLMRSVHNYASGALVITTLLHAFRTLFMERFRGPRWLAWVTGIVMTVIVWLAGVTGYWLIWDTRAQLITDSFGRFLGLAAPLADRFTAYLVRAETTRSWPLLLLILLAHVLLFLLTAFFFWLHIRRLSRPKWMPDVHWVVGVSVVLLLGGILFPVGILAKADPLALPGRIELDPIFLFYLPTSGQTIALWLWGGLLLLVVGGSALPWLSRGKRPTPAPKVNIIKDRCTGCTKCALDCPYEAIQMVPRHDDKPHKFIAIEDPSLCVSCGICVGSCDGVAVTLGDTPPEFLWLEVSSRLALAQAKLPAGQVKLIFTCERHASHGARPYLDQPTVLDGQQVVEVITLPCVGTAPPDLLTRALDAGAAEVQVVGCPPDDCTNREGNLWAERRLLRKRVPRLKRAYANAPITAAWLPPDDFAQALHSIPLPMVAAEDGQAATPDYLESRRMRRPLTWRNLLPAFALLALVLVAQILLTALPFDAYPSRPGQISVVLDDPTAPFGPFEAKWLPDHPLTLQLSVDNELLLTQTFLAGDLFTLDRLPGDPRPFTAELPISPGEHHVELLFTDPQSGTNYFLFNRQVAIEPGEILRITDASGYNGICKEGNCTQ